ncbi:MAG TPA: flagellar hook-associated protein FlgL [Firmicutes bacterium]|jgi:flagellar hook-associated protein 3 FlgL|nr:flagellar hook-associated protein FlgL [Bacillota bacterium]
MRITNGITHHRLVNNIQRGLGRLDTYYNQLSTRKRLNYPSDDPVGLAIGLNLKEGISEGAQYKKNAQTAIGWLNSADDALGQMTKVLHRLQELCVSGGNGSLPPESMNALADEVTQLRDHLLQLANTRHEKRYIFAGQQTDDPPFLFDDTLVVGDPGRFQYQGDDEGMVIEIGTGVTLTITHHGEEIFGTNAQFFHDLDTFIEDLRAMDHATVATTHLEMLSDKLDDVLSVRSQIGAKVQRLERTVERYEAMDVNLKGLLSKIEDADIAEVTMNMMMKESVYQAALATGARIIQNTLVDYV